jgi:hypothetical protein
MPPDHQNQSDGRYWIHRTGVMSLALAQPQPDAIRAACRRHDLEQIMGAAVDLVMAIALRHPMVKADIDASKPVIDAA